MKSLSIFSQYFETSKRRKISRVGIYKVVTLLSNTRGRRHPQIYAVKLKINTKFSYRVGRRNHENF